MREEHEFTWLWFGFILAAFMMVSLNVWGCVCKELAAPVPKAAEGRAEYVIVRDKMREDYYGRPDDY